MVSLAASFDKQVHMIGASAAGALCDVQRLPPQVERMVDNDAALALAASGADDKYARIESASGALGPLLRNFSRIKMTNEERSVAA
jgi:hypothetical protein